MRVGENHTVNGSVSFLGSLWWIWEVLKGIAPVTAIVFFSECLGHNSTKISENIIIIHKNTFKNRKL